MNKFIFSKHLSTNDIIYNKVLNMVNLIFNINNQGT